MAVFGAIATGTAWQGSLYMALFGLGTIPLMTTAIYLGKFLNALVKQRIQKLFLYLSLLLVPYLFYVA